MVKNLARGLIVLLVMCGVGALVLWQLTLASPGWYNPPDPADRSVAALADNVEYHVVQNLQQNRPIEKRWAIRLTQDHINAWLSARLQKWIQHDTNIDWPSQLGTPQLRLEADRVSIALPIDVDQGRPRWLVARVKPAIVHGKLAIALDRVALGRVELPGEPTANLLQEMSAAAPQLMSDSQLQNLIDALAQRRAIDPVFELSDGRRVRLTDVRISEGQIDLVAQTLHAGE